MLTETSGSCFLFRQMGQVSNVGLVFGIWSPRCPNKQEMGIKLKRQIYSLYRQLPDAPTGTSIGAVLVELCVYLDSPLNPRVS
jgi:hypothetical protein